MYPEQDVGSSYTCKFAINLDELQNTEISATQQ